MIVLSANRCNDVPTDANCIGCEKATPALEARRRPHRGGLSRTLSLEATVAVLSADMFGPHSIERLKCDDATSRIGCENSRVRCDRRRVMADGWRRSRPRVCRSGRWLFPGRQRGQPINSVSLQVHPREIGLPPQRDRTSAIRQLVLQAPAPVIAKARGYHDKTATRLVTEAGGTWS